MNPKLRNRLAIVAAAVLAGVIGVILDRTWLAPARSAGNAAPVRSTPPAHTATDRAATAAAGEETAAAEPAAALPEAALYASLRQALGDLNQPIENFFVEGGALSARKVALLHSDDSYGQFMQRLQSDTTPTGGADALAFQQSFSAQPQALDGSVTLNGLACGDLLCAASLQSRDEASASHYLDGAFNGAEHPVYAVVPIQVTSPAGVETRVLFSTSPSLKNVLPNPG